MNIKNYGFPVFRFLNQWQVTLFCSHNVKPVDHYVSLDNLGRYSLVYVFKREEAKELLKKFKNRELEIGLHVVTYQKKPGEYEGGLY